MAIGSSVDLLKSYLTKPPKISNLSSYSSNASRAGVGRFPWSYDVQLGCSDRLVFTSRFLICKNTLGAETMAIAVSVVAFRSICLAR